MKRRGEVDAIVGGFIGQRTLAEAIEFFEKAEVTAAPVYDIGQFLDDPHVQERGIVVEAPDDDMGEVPMHAIVPRLSDTPGRLRSAGADDRPAQSRDLRRASATPTSASPRSRRKGSSDDGRPARPSLVPDSSRQRPALRGEGLHPRRRCHRPRPRGLGARPRKRRAPASSSAIRSALAGRGGAEVLVRVNNDPALLADDIDAVRAPRARRPVDPQGGIGRADPRHRGAHRAASRAPGASRRGICACHSPSRRRAGSWPSRRSRDRATASPP